MTITFDTAGTHVYAIRNRKGIALFRFTRIEETLDFEKGKADLVLMEEQDQNAFVVHLDKSEEMALGAGLPIYVLHLAWKE